MLKRTFTVGVGRCLPITVMWRLDFLNPTKLLRGLLAGPVTELVTSSRLSHLTGCSLKRLSACTALHKNALSPRQTMALIRAEATPRAALSVYGRLRYPELLATLLAVKAIEATTLTIIGIRELGLHSPRMAPNPHWCNYCVALLSPVRE
jgi:hypothetical protein